MSHFFKATFTPKTSNYCLKNRALVFLFLNGSKRTVSESPETVEKPRNGEMVVFFVLKTDFCLVSEKLPELVFFLVFFGGWGKPM